VIWDELGRPDLNNTIVSRFSLAQEVAVLDFQLPPSAAWHMFKTGLTLNSQLHPRQPRTEISTRYNAEFISTYIRTWPLIAACSIRILDRQEFFFPQYIIPQLLLEWVRTEKRFDGIRYFSTRSDPSHYYGRSNCVFPARNIKPRGFCSYLTDRFKLTPPVPWQIIRQFDRFDRLSIGPSNATAPFQLAAKASAMYAATEFYKVECNLKFLDEFEV
jgi:hypothetical protein